jgi:hypothetical protein
MEDLQEVVSFVAKALVDDPDEVRVEVIEGERTVIVPDIGELALRSLAGIDAGHGLVGKLRELQPALQLQGERADVPAPKERVLVKLDHGPPPSIGSASGGRAGLACRAGLRALRRASG